MCTNILFVIPPSHPLSTIESTDKVTRETYIPTSIPLGVLSISSYIKKYSEVNIKILDLNIMLSNERNRNLSFKSLFSSWYSKATYDFNPDIVAISALFNSNFSYLEIITSSVKKVNRNALLITGGGLPTNMYNFVLTHVPLIDAVCFAEGEIPMMELVNSKDRLQYLEESSYWITQNKKNTDFKPVAKFVTNLDEIPTPDYNLINFSDYQKTSRYHGSDNSSSVSLMTSRGCPFRCCFCASHSVHGKKIRLMSAQRVLSDIEFLMDRFDVKTFLVEDDHFLLDKQRALEILNGLVEKNINIEFPNGLAVHSIDGKIAIALKNAGVKIATLAVESGSENVLKNIIHKPLTLDIVKSAVSILRNVDIYIRAFFIIGFPGEMPLDRQKTIDFIKAVGFNWVAIMIASPIAGSELYKICVENNYLVSNNIEDFHFGKGNIKTEDIDPEFIENVRYVMNLELNFVNNYDLMNGNFETALVGFNDVIKRVPTHAFAYYYASLCYDKLDQKEKSREYVNEFYKIIESDSRWKNYAQNFKLHIGGI
ncbi:MAG: B12-binding domain-containing radical SAM protein [Clostridia bacterium]|nr:B12-binding domain-containing radical SAM protein [Clostridia bacterium]